MASTLQSVWSTSVNSGYGAVVVSSTLGLWSLSHGSVMRTVWNYISCLLPQDVSFASIPDVRRPVTFLCDSFLSSSLLGKVVLGYREALESRVRGPKVIRP